MDSNLSELIKQMEKIEKEICNFPLVFSEMLKNEINANDEHEMYIEFLKVIKKYSKDEKSMSAINSFFSAITGGAELDEVMTIAVEEAQDPSVASELTVDESCKLK